MNVRRLVPVACLAVLSSLPARAQTTDLRDLLTGFLREGITLAPPSAGFPSHEAHFISSQSPQFAALTQFNANLAAQLSSFPLASSTGGFTYKYDPALGVFSRSSDSFGPIYGERADTIGRGKFNLGINHSSFTFDKIDGVDLRGSALKLVFTHQDTNNDGSELNPFFEGDVITASIYLRVATKISAFVMSYGVTDNLDLGIAVPLVSVRLDARTDAAIQRLGSGVAAPTIHRFANGGTEESFTSRGDASGVGDVVVRAKYKLLGTDTGGLALAADVRLPTGDERDLLGTGVTQVQGGVVGSLQLGPFSPHVVAGYRWAAKDALADEISVTAGFDVALSPRITFAADVLGRLFRDTQAISVQNRTYTANTSTNPANPVIVTGQYPTLIVEKKNQASYLGSLGFKVNPFGNFLLTVNGLFSLNDKGLQDSFSPLVALEYNF
ncbi:MAG: transporter [Acidobacteria bacterium]|nr:transporter [Acidobacteriota bacterium]